MRFLSDSKRGLATYSMEGVPELKPGQEFLIHWGKAQSGRFALRAVMGNGLVLSHIVGNQDWNLWHRTHTFFGSEDPVGGPMGDYDAFPYDALEEWLAAPRPIGYSLDLLTASLHARELGEAARKTAKLLEAYGHARGEAKRRRRGEVKRHVKAVSLLRLA